MARQRRTGGEWVLELVSFATTFVAYILIVQASYRWNPGDPYSLQIYHVLIAVFAVLPAVILIHEVGHALAGAMVGFRPFRVAVGAGPRLFAFDVGRTRVELNMLLTSGGFTEMGTTRPGAIHLRHAIAVFGGPLAPVLVALVVLGTPTSSTTGEVLRASFVGVALYTSVLSLLPQTVRGMWSDGRQLLASLRPDPVHTRALLTAHDQLSLRDAIEGSDTEGITALGASSSAAVASAARVTLGDWDGAVDAARAGLAAAHRDEAPVLQNNLAYALAKRGRPDDLEEALSLIEQIDPDLAPSVADTVGLVLVRAGRPAEAIPRLRAALASSDLSAATVAEVAAHLAEACHAAGDAHGARHALAKAIRSDPSGTDVATAVALVAPREAEVIGEFWASLDGDAESRARQIITALGDALPATLAALRHHARDEPEAAELLEVLVAARASRRTRR